MKAIKIFEFVDFLTLIVVFANVYHVIPFVCSKLGFEK